MMQDAAGGFPDFRGFFEALNGHAPFPWQERLAAQVDSGGWPAAIGLPTASGKTACMDIAVWALAREAFEAPTHRRMPRRMLLVVDRRIVVDDAFRRAQRIAAAVNGAGTGPLAIAKAALEKLGGEVPLHATVLRGAILRDERWARTPLQPTLVVSTVDQVGSRLLFRGYGIGEHARPIHAGLLAFDTLVLLDEAHLSRPFEETLEWISHHRRLGESPINLPFVFSRMTATPPPGGAVFEPNSEDHDHPVLGKRLKASKPASILKPVKASALAKQLAEAVAQACRPGATIAVVANRVKTARDAFEILRANRKLDAESILLTGRARPHERDRIVQEHLPRLGSGRDREAHAEAKPLIVVATQCIEAGADVDFDYLVTECAPLDALRQRFGRLDRLGELPPASGEPRAAILVDEKSAKPETVDAVYGPALAKTWEWLCKAADADGRLDFGIEALKLPGPDELASLLSPRACAPLLQRAYCDLLIQTSPEPVPSPDPAAFLHGVDRGDPEVQIVWRADLGEDAERWADVVSLCPPVAGEALPLRLSAARAWLHSLAAVDAPLDALAEDADLEGIPPTGELLPGGQRGAGSPNGTPPSFLRWRGPEDSVVESQPSAIRPGDTLVLPSTLGGCDAFGFSLDARDPVEDIAEAARSAAGRARVLRLHPDLAAKDQPPALQRLSTLREEPEEGLRAAVAEALAQSDATASGRWRATMHPAGQGVVVLWPRAKPTATFSDADDSSARSAEPVELGRHNADVADRAEDFALKAGLGPALASAIRLAASAHDLGKADPRFQAMLHGGSRIHALAEGRLLAKSDAAASTPAARRAAQAAAGYPKGARHELLSVRLLESDPEALAAAHDPDLVLHLVASHHGRCRPFAPVIEDPQPFDVHIEFQGIPLSASTDTGLHRIDSGVPGRFFRLARRYGWWGLAYLESLVRLADHRVSEHAPQED